MPEDINFFDGVYSQRQFTRYKTDPVPKEAIDKVIEAATKAPNGGNAQPWHFVAVTDRNLVEEVGRHYREQWLANTGGGVQGEKSPPGEPRVYQFARYLANHIHESPALLIACADHSRGYMPYTPGEPIVQGRYASSLWLAVQNMFLAARAQGLGTRICGIGRREQEVKEILGLPDYMETVVLSPLGCPRGKFGPADRMPASQFTHYNHWGNRPNGDFKTDGAGTEIGLMEAMNTQRQMTRYKPDPVPIEAINKMIEAATKAPSGANCQAWEFMVITEPDLISEVSRHYREQWLGSRGGSPEGPPDEPRVYQFARYLANHIHESPALMLVCVDHKRGFIPYNADEPLSRDRYASSIWLAIQNLFLAGRTLGLGTRLTTTHIAREPQIKELLGIPDHVETVMLTPVGYPRGRFGAPDRLPPSEVSSYNRFGNKG